MDKPRFPDAASEVCKLNLHLLGLPTQFGPRTWYIGSTCMCTLGGTPLVVRDYGPRGVRGVWNRRLGRGRTAW